MAQLVEAGKDLTQLTGIGSHMAAHIRYGIDQARRGWLEKRHVVNTRPWAEFRQWLPLGS